MSSKLEANASHAVGQYLTRGPSLPPEEMVIAGLEGVRSRLEACPTAFNMEVYGWVTVEQTFALSAASDYIRDKYPIEPLFMKAEDAFTESLERHDDVDDGPDHLRRVELAMFALPIYEAWAGRQALKAADVAEFHENVVEIGQTLLDTKPEFENGWSEDDIKSVNGLVSEVVVCMALNRRNRDGFSGKPMAAIPSTLRQNLSRVKGPVGDKWDSSRLRGNWDLSVIQAASTDAAPAMTKKIQVKSILHLPDAPRYGSQTPEYTDDITVVGVADHLCRPNNVLNAWQALDVLVMANEGGAPKRHKNLAASISRSLFARIGK